jgi:3-phosphoshikimate 1-carboxyvinyltransferase
MLTYTISKKDRKLSGEISLPPSVSISNRNLLIKALKNAKFDMKTISEKDAARVIDKSLRKGKVALDKGEPAKAIRFLRAFLAYFKGEWIVTGTEEMHKRPIGDVIDMLSNQGFNIKYLIREGFPPLKIIGKGFKGSITRVDSTICSQFISTTLLMSQSLPADEVVELKNRIVNSPFIDQTIRLLRYLGVNNNWEKEEILVEYELNDGTEMSIEADWKSASYWYEMAAIASKTDFKIKGLNPSSVQGDAIVKEIFEPLGVKTETAKDGIVLKKVKRKIKTFEYDFLNNPDLVPTLATTCIALHIPFRFVGVEQLRLKETDRIMILQSQMLKLGAKLTVEKKGDTETLCFNGKSKIAKLKEVDIETFNDHRMVMSFAPLAMLGIDVTVDNPKVVTKSYPCYWEDFKKMSISVEQTQRTINN